MKRLKNRYGHSRRLGVELLEDRRLLAVVPLSAGVEPTNYDQYLLELINRGRANPTAEASLHGVSLNQGLAAGTISTAPKQPLAFHPALIAAARGHSDWMIQTDTFSHIGQGGSNAATRMATAGYGTLGTFGCAENIAWKGTTGTFNRIDYVNDLHRSLFRSASHRVNLMNDSYREFGTGVFSGRFRDAGINYNALMVTENFAFSGSSVFLTGVVYDDGLVSANQFYTPEEGLGGVTVTATRHSDGQRFSTNTWGSGGYTLPVDAGTYTVTAAGGALTGTLIKNSVSITNRNVKVDFTLADNVAPVVSSLAAAPSSVSRTDVLTLTAHGVSDPNGHVKRVQFYRDTNGSGVWDPDDQVLGSDTSSSGGWTWSGSTAGWALGTHRIFARAQDNQNAWSEPVTAVVHVHNAVPSINHLAACANWVYQADSITLSASGVHDPDGTVVAVEFYRGNTLLGTQEQGSHGWNWTADTTSWPLGQHTVSARARDNDGEYSESVSTTITVNAAIPVVASLSATPETQVRPGTITLTAHGVSAPVGEPVRVEFYRGNTLLGVDENGDDGWSWTTSTAGWNVGQSTFSARVESCSGHWSETVTTTATVENAFPMVASLSASPAVVLEGQSIELSAAGVADLDGTVVQVDFYRNGTLLGTDTDAGNGWTWTGSTAGWPTGAHEFSVRAWDNDGASSELASATATLVAELQPLDFGVVPVFTSVQRELVICNVGPEPLIIPGLQQHPPFTMHPAEGFGEAQDWIIPPGSTVSFLVSYTPSAEGTDQAVLPLIGDPIGRQVEQRGSAVAGWRNTVNPFDVNGDGTVTPADVLLMINAINHHGARQLPERTAEQPGPPWFLDPNGDGRLTPKDVLTVINHLNRNGASVPEAEADRVFSEGDQEWDSLRSIQMPEDPVGGMQPVASDRPERHSHDPSPVTNVPEGVSVNLRLAENNVHSEWQEPCDNRPYWTAEVASDPFQLEALLSDLLPNCQLWPLGRI